MNKHLILGGARSGKSAYAEKLAIASGKNLIYVATAQALDGEMQLRIQHHQHSRSNRWRTIEEPQKLAEVLLQHATADTYILVDCLTLWLTNLLLAGDHNLQQERDELFKILPQLSGNILFVSNEVGMGVVPADPLSRRFVDEAGRLHQQLAAVCDEVTLMVAGLPLSLKSSA
ncbi:MAG: bifunctional adenosylcobinamide kinase/adenosylcobinamide-phosphate guanylyltransferase [Pseudomonadales bacterium]|nr:bifunctional adenosylcobinamide kinase/adenosylcobinamide-phosphate guanylyltransferase [Pseudomonadales bacterium]